jgi:thiol-disulfide isomerase/thioredoxin
MKLSIDRKFLLTIPILTLVLGQAPGGVTDGLKSLDHPEPAPEINLPDLSGTTNRLSDLEGKVVVVNFWASWCTPCVRELPALERLKDRLEAGGGTVLAVNAGESLSQIKRFLKHRPTTLLVLRDEQSEALSDWNVTFMPTTFVVNPAGRVVMRVVGETLWDEQALVDRIQGYR